MQGFVLPPEAGGIECRPGGGTEVRQGLPADADGFENRCAGRGCAGCPQRVCVRRDPGDQGPGCLGAMAGQGIGGMRANPVAQNMLCRMIGLLFMITENVKDRFEVKFAGMSGEEM